MKTKTCCFAGHATLYGSEETIKSKLKNKIRNLIKNEKATTFYSDGKKYFIGFVLIVSQIY